MMTSLSVDRSFYEPRFQMVVVSMSVYKMRRAGCPHVDCVTCRSGTSVERDFVEAPSQMCWLSACWLCYVS